MLVAVGALGCGFSHIERDIDRTPVVNTGVGATILYPGQTAPVYTPGASGAPAPAGASTPATGAPTNSGGAEAGGAQGSGAGSGGGVTFIGGTATDEERHISVRSEPPWYKYLALPFVAVAAPFKRIASGDKPEPGPEPPTAVPAPAPTSAPPPVDYETSQIENLERELDQRLARERSSAVDPAPAPPQRIGSGGTAPLSIADELGALQRRPAPPAPRVAEPPATESSAAQVESSPEAQGIVDRNGDGRVDHWIFREAGHMARETFDEDFDGRPDRTLLYDPATRQVYQVEEDSDRDGTVDSWTDYRDGALVRRRADLDNDGSVDSWTFYRQGHVTRLEQDTSGDGFRDRVGFFEAGRLVREEIDSNADGHLDVTTHYDERERIARREEDNDGDGRVDLISHYEDGRLARTELLDPDALGHGVPQPDTGR